MTTLSFDSRSSGDPPTVTLSNSIDFICARSDFGREKSLRSPSSSLNNPIRSPWAGVFVSAIIVGVAHAPGLYLRGGADTDGSSAALMQVIAYTIAVLAPMGLLFGLIYARTKSLLLVVLLHGLVDVLPNMNEFIRTWT